MDTLRYDLATDVVDVWTYDDDGRLVRHVLSGDKRDTELEYDARGKFYPFSRVGVQASVGAFGAWLVGGTGVTLGAGPAGTFTGLRAHLGVRLEL